ncbi:MAG TPA: aminotransferase class IV, partial [Promineifilum sp.]
ARTERSMLLLGWNYVLDRARLQRSLHDIVTAAEWPEMRVRIDVLAGPAETLGASGRELIAIQPFTPPAPELYESGVTVDFAEGLVREMPLAKTAEFAAARPLSAGIAQLESTGAVAPDRPAPYEYLLLDRERRILEGTGTNFWAVRDGVVYTAGEGVLEGITREILLELIPLLGMPVRKEAIGEGEIETLDEAALSGSSRAFMPVVSMAGQPIGDGRPGPVGRRILAAYNDYLATNLKPAI